MSAEDTDGSDEVIGTAEEAGPVEAAAPPRTRRPMSALRRHLGAVVLVVALLASAGAAAAVYFSQYRQDRDTDAAAMGTALEAAKTGTVALLSYSPDSLDKDFAAAKSHLTGEFLSYYTDFTTKVVAPAATQKAVQTKADVVQGAVSEIHPDTAQVLLFINQTTVSKENPDGSFAASSVKVGLKKIDGAWLIEKFDPV